MIRLTTLGLVFLGLTVAAWTPVAMGQDAAGENTTSVVHRLNHLPVADLMKPIEAILEAAADGQSPARAIVVPESITNSLLIHGKTDAVKRILQLVEQLDQKPRSVFVELVIVSIATKEKPGRIPIQADGTTTADDVVAALEKQGKAQVVARVQLSALDNQAAFIQLGRREPRVTGVRESSQGLTRQVELENVGLIMSLTPRITPEGSVTMEVDVERSSVDKEGQGVELSTSSGEQTLGVDVLTLQTTVCARDGQLTILGGLTQGSGDDWRKLVVLLTPKILPTE